MPEQQTPQPANGTQSRIFDPGARGEAPPRRPAEPEESTDRIERDPDTGRFLRPGFPGHLVSKARRLGLTDEDLRDIEDVRELKDLVRERDFEARISQVFDPKRVAEVLKAQNGTNLEQPTAARQPFDLGLNDEEDGPRLTELLTKLRDHYEGEIADLKKTVSDLGGKQQAREVQEGQSFARRVEKAFAKHPNVFGTGKIDTLDRNSLEFKFRMEAVAAHRTAGADGDSLQDDVDSFVASLASKFGRKTAVARGRQPEEYGEEEPEDDELEEDELDEAEQWERGVLSRPTQAGSREAPPGREKAIQGVKRRLAPTQARDARQPRGIYLNHGSRTTGRPPPQQR